MTDRIDCAICAWRETCQKKFSVCGKDLRCTDFVRDVAIAPPPEEEEPEENSSGER